MNIMRQCKECNQMGEDLSHLPEIKWAKIINLTKIRNKIPRVLKS